MKLTRFSEVDDRISFIILCSKSFPKIGPFGDDHKQNIELAFDSLREALPIIEKKVIDPLRFDEVVRLLDSSLGAYRAGETKKGAHLLQDILDISHPTRYAEYEARKGGLLDGGIT